MKALPRSIWLAILALLAAATVAPAQLQVDRVNAEVLADATGVTPGGTVTLGVLLTIEPQWHVYWINPGDSGRPTTVKFQAPAGVTFGELRYPVPIQFTQPGDMVGYGYEGKVLHAVDVRVPADAKPGADITIDADVAWLVCKDVCVPGKAKLSITLPVTREPAKANEKVFAEWADRWPRGLNRNDQVKHLRWIAEGGKVTCRVVWNKPPKQVELYPGRLPAVAVEGADVKTDGKRTDATVTLRQRPGQTLEADALPSLLVYTADDGTRHGINMDIPIGALHSAGPGMPEESGG